MEKIDAIKGSLKKWKAISEKLEEEGLAEKLFDFPGVNNLDYYGDSKFDQLMFDMDRADMVISHLCPMCEWTKQENRSPWVKCCDCDLHDERYACCKEWDKIDSLAKSMASCTSPEEIHTVIRIMQGHAFALVSRLYGLLSDAGYWS